MTIRATQRLRELANRELGLRECAEAVAEFCAANRLVRPSMRCDPRCGAPHLDQILVINSPPIAFSALFVPLYELLQQHYGLQFSAPTQVAWEDFAQL